MDEPAISSGYISGAQIISRSGYGIRIDSPNWQLDKNIKIPVNSILRYLNDESRYSFLQVLAVYVRNNSASHVQNIFFRFLHFLREVSPNGVSTTSLINYRVMLTKNTEWYIGVIRGFLKKWHSLGYAGIPDDVIELLEGWTIKGNIKGDTIKRLDPIKGPLSDIELQGFNESTVQAFERGNISSSDMAIGLIISNTGRRPIQISHLRLKDVLLGKNKRGDEAYLINIPRAKQRATAFREQFKQFAITKELWVVLTAQAESVIKLVEKAIGFSLQGADRLELPLFPDFEVVSAITSPSAFKSLSKTDQLHLRSEKIGAVCKDIVEYAQLNSERTGELLKISSNRFRYTTGTRAAREGFGEMVIAELLDHSDTQNAGVYIENIPEHVESLDRAVGQQLARYAQAFAGVLVDSEKLARRGNDINSRIKVGANGVGTCGTHGFCGANIPIPCYTCIHFQPWLDGPHEIILQELVDDRERIIGVTGDKQIAAINDRSILAVMDVIQRCNVRREELNNG